MTEQRVVTLRMRLVACFVTAVVAACAGVGLSALLLGADRGPAGPAGAAGPRGPRGADGPPSPAGRAGEAASADEDGVLETIKSNSAEVANDIQADLSPD